jgi:hypothetical protein
MGGIIRESEEPQQGTHALDYSELQVSGFKEQFLVNLKRNFIVYNRAPGEAVHNTLCGSKMHWLMMYQSTTWPLST